MLLKTSAQNNQEILVAEILTKFSCDWLTSKLCPVSTKTIKSLSTFLVTISSLQAWDSIMWSAFLKILLVKETYFFCFLEGLHANFYSLFYLRISVSALNDDSFVTAETIKLKHTFWPYCLGNQGKVDWLFVKSVSTKLIHFPCDHLNKWHCQYLLIRHIHSR